MKRSIILVALMIIYVTTVALSQARAQSFSLDDNPSDPRGGNLGTPPDAPPGPGFGAEDPFGLRTSEPALAPSPSLAALPFPNLGDGAILSPSPNPGTAQVVVQHPSPNGFYVSSLSANKGLLPVSEVSLVFSVDRLSIGMPGTAVRTEATLNQAAGDVYATTVAFTHPGAFAGTLPVSVGFAGFLPGSMGAGSNTLIINQGLPDLSGTVPGLGLLTGPAVVQPEVMAPSIGPGTHDNLDAFDFATFSTSGFLFDINTYFTVYPAEALVFPFISPADILLAEAGTPGADPTTPFANSAMLGLVDRLAPYPGMWFSDAIDALVIFDEGIVGGIAQPGIDYALFSLAPGSRSLEVLGGLINDSDVFFTDFTGSFAVYAQARALGLIGDPNGGATPRSRLSVPGSIDGLDALDIKPIPEPATLSLVGVGIAGLLLLGWRRRR